MNFYKYFSAAAALRRNHEIRQDRCRVLNSAPEGVLQLEAVRDCGADAPCGIGSASGHGALICPSRASTKCSAPTV
jgi:hypothetical protein